jgi:imidazolonepropionase-like amidohydrolase
MERVRSSVKGDSLGSGVGSPTPETAAEAIAVVRDLKAAGVDAIKIERDDLSWCSSFRLALMKPEVLSALVSEAHQQGLKAYVHAPMLDPAKDALRAGADGLLHGIIDRPVDAEFIDLMKRNAAVYVPTLSLYEDVADIAGFARRQSSYDSMKFLPADIYDSLTAPAAVTFFQSIFNNTRFTKDRLPALRSNVKTVFDAGIPVVLGTDTGLFGVFLGVSTHLELNLLTEAGLAPQDALRSATINASRMLGHEKDLGEIAKGRLADIVILDAYPLDDIRNSRRVYRVMKGGVVYDPAQVGR